MYISCPECDTKFVLTPEQIGAEGRRVKCSKCSHVWHQKLDANVKIEPLLSPMPMQDIQLGNGVNLPALLPIKIPVYMYVMPVLLLIATLFMLVAMFPDKLGIESILSNKHLSVKDITVNHQKDLGKITVSYKVFNASNKEAKMPLIRVRLFDKSNRVLKSSIVDHTQIDLAPKQYLLIKTEFAPAPPSAESVDVMIGNKIDFIFR